MNMDKILVGRSLLYNIQSTTRNQFISSSSSSSSYFVAYFRSTPACFDKWKGKWNNNSSDSGGPKPSKTYVKYKTRQLRADAKKALKDLFNCRSTSKFTLEGEFLGNKGRRSLFDDHFNPIDNKTKRDPSKSANRRASKPHQKRNKRKSRRGDFFEEFDDDPETHFHAKFGNRQYSWSFRSWEESFSQSKINGFEWRDDSNWSYNSNNKNNWNKWRTISDDESSDDDEPYVVGSSSDRIALGLPMNGPLKIDEVKNAFRLSALKWHPDRNQGPSKALAEEKFKVCVSAYNSLCTALSKV